MPDIEREFDYAVIEKIFGPFVRFHADIFYDCAKEANNGVIVELGTYKGAGAITLALGTRRGNNLLVYTIDDRVNRKGWIGESYTDEDYLAFEENVKRADVHIVPIVCDAFDAAENYRHIWKSGIALLYWSLGTRDHFALDFKAWGKYVVPDGFFIAKDAGQGELGTEPVIQEALRTGEWERELCKGGISVLRKLTLP